MATRILGALLGISLLVATLAAQRVEVEEFTLENGMQFLLLPRSGDPNVAAGWVSKFGSVNERPGVTGVAHLFEHMMFKGTRTIGTKDIDRDLAIIDELDALRAEIESERAVLLEKQRRGLIEDPSDPANRSPAHTALLERFEVLIAEQHALLVKDEFSRIYTTNGGSGMNAGTTSDFTIYFINVPANKLELWFWMESDRLADPVFREFYAERDVVREERRLRTDSTPTGKLNEQFESMFWQASPYGWPVIGWPSDLDAITRAEAMEFFDLYYAPNNLVAALVGDFDPNVVKALARKYFGRLERGAREPGPVRTREVEQQAEQRLAGHAETRPQATIRFHTVPDAHVDEPPLIVLSAVLNGRTGRLYKSLVLEQKVAVQAGAGVNGRKYDGSFEISGVAAPGSTPEDVEAALLAELELLEVARARTLQGLARRNDRLDRILSREFARLLRDRHFTTVQSTQASIQAVTRERMQGFHAQRFDPRGMFFSVSGDFDTADMVRRLNAALADGWPGETVAPGDIPAPTHEPVPGVYMFDKTSRDVNQSHVAIGHLGIQRDHPDAFKVRIMNSVLGGGGFTSRIMVRVRSDEGLAYSAYSRYVPGTYYPGTFQAGFQSRNATCAQAAAIVIEEIERIRASKVTVEELDTAKNYLIEIFPRFFATAGQVAGTFASDEFTGRAKDYWQRYRQRIADVSADDVLDAAQKHLHPEKLVILAVGAREAMLQGNPDKPEFSFESLAGDGGIRSIQLPDPLTMEYPDA